MILVHLQYFHLFETSIALQYFYLFGEVKRILFRIHVWYIAYWGLYLIIITIVGPTLYTGRVPHAGHWNDQRPSSLRQCPWNSNNRQYQSCSVNLLSKWCQIGPYLQILVVWKMLMEDVTLMILVDSLNVSDGLKFKNCKPSCVWNHFCFAV